MLLVDMTGGNKPFLPVCTIKEEIKPTYLLLNLSFHVGIIHFTTWKA